MQILIMHGGAARSRMVQLSAWQLVLAGVVLVMLMLMLSGTVYHYLFQKAAREGWPVVSQIVKLVVRDEFAQRDRFLRENLDVMAQRLGEVQAKLVRLDAVSERVASVAGIKPADLELMRRLAPSPGAPAASGATGGPNPSPADSGGQGGPYLPVDRPSLEQLQATASIMDESADRTADIFTLIESRLFEARLRNLMVPSTKPVDVQIGSGFGFRRDPFTGRPALHAGLDFPADVGTPIMAAAGGVVGLVEYHPAYGNVVEVDHGNQLVTRYAHASRIVVKQGELVKKGQKIAEVGSSGRSTGPHLHFEVLVEGVPQDPARFLAGRAETPPTAATGRR
ncbi:MAG: M23 family metallopeptidase [Rubrivivax sp.]|jgi:murein DD-endopeptidase MepM/ murein hydrolase activator NlpD|nr:M23 family metallopeptidase [Rubrivivax sp.]